MRVLMITWEFPPNMVGGIGKHVAELVPALSQNLLDNPAFHLDVLTNRSAGGARLEQATPNVTIHRVDTPPLAPNDLFNSVVDGNRRLETYALRLAASAPYDLIHVHDWLVASAGIALKHFWKVPLVVTIHATERGRHQSHVPNQTSVLINQTEWEVCFEAWRVIVCSGFMAGELGGYFGVPLDKTSVIANGIDPAPLRGCAPDVVARLRLRYAPNGERLLFFVGRITPEKGLSLLLRAMPHILRHFPDVRLLVAGKNSEQMQSLVDELGISQAVELLGFVTDEARNCLYNTVDAAVFPSLYEPFGIVALEAMAAGCNVIVSDVGGLSEVVHHMHNGLTVIANNPQSIAWGVDVLFEDEERAAQWRATARENAETLYRWSDIAARTYELYKSVVEERRQVEW
ncbi:MAG: glycosyltransferase family 4 protein [Caldilineaceae bacterium]|nr:glycosyltransferase family 4 protein [Caldilineaceae bacterium]